MAQQLKEAVKGGDARNTSHGRGGAGNISSNANTGVDASELSTPTIKSQNYTTGRGGSGASHRSQAPRMHARTQKLTFPGNMVPNENPNVARAAQDVDAPAHHEKAPTGTYHWGRGGEGNKMTLGNGEETKRSSSKDPAGEKRRGSFQGALDKGRDLLGLNKGKKQDKNGSEAVEE